MTSRAVALAALMTLIGCGKKSSERDRDRACTEDTERFEPSATEIPLPEDYRETAEKRVGPDNYQRELARIARELGSGEREKRPSEEELTGEVTGEEPSH